MAEAQLILRQQIDAIFDDGAAQTAKGRAAQKRAAKAEAKGLVWTLSALALAACGGGGGGGSPAPVTGGQAVVTPPPASGGRAPLIVSPQTVANEILTEEEDKALGTKLAAMTNGQPKSLEDVNGADVDDFTATGAFEVENSKIDPDMLISVRIGGIIDPTTGVQTRGAGADLLDGGAGYDRVFYIASPVGVTVDLTAGTGRGGYH